MTSNNKAKKKRTKKSGVFKRLEQRELKRSQDVFKKFNLAVCFIIDVDHELQTAFVGIVDPAYLDSDYINHPKAILSSVLIHSNFGFSPALKKGDLGMLFNGCFWHFLPAASGHKLDEIIEYRNSINA